MSRTTNTNAKKTMQVLSTTDYSKFIVLEGNRGLNSLHLNRLKTSMEEDYLISPITVNEKMEVIDGQHRLSCCKELKLPVYYIVCEGYGLPEIQRLNSNTKNWNMDDFLSGYLALGKKEYEFYRNFKDLYGFGHSETLVLLTGNAKGGDAVKLFQAGKLRIKNYNNACVIAEKIKKCAPYYDGWKRRGFVQALLQLLKNPKFDIEEFVAKLKFQQTKMVDCSRSSQYLQVIEEIYNFKRRNEEKVSFKYAA